MLHRSNDDDDDLTTVMVTQETGTMSVVNLQLGDHGFNSSVMYHLYGDVVADSVVHESKTIQQQTQQTLFAYFSRKVWGDEEVDILEEMRGT